MPFTPDQAKLLSAKLDPAHVKPPKSFGPKGDYIEGWHAIAEANRIFGFDGWSYDVRETKCVSERDRKIGKDGKPGFGVTYIAEVCVIVEGIQRVDVGAGHGYDVDCGLAHESAIKEAVTDALKRALRTFGNVFGLALYDKTRENVGVDAPAVHLLDDYTIQLKSLATPDAIRDWCDKMAKPFAALSDDDWKVLEERIGKWTDYVTKKAAA